MKFNRKLMLLAILAIILCLGLTSAQTGDRPEGDGGKDGGKEDGEEGGKGSKGPPAGGRPGKDFAVAKKMKQGKVGASFGKVGGAIRFCFDEDVCEHAISMVFDRLTEVNATVNGTVVQRAKKFSDAEFEVSDPVTEQDNNGSYRVQVDYMGNISVGTNDTDSGNATFKMSSYIYLNASTTEFGNQTIDIAKESLKFSVNITDWPFLSSNNSLAFGVQLAVRTRNGYKGEQKPEKKRGRGRGGKIARFELGEGEYLDVPELCITDGVQNSVQSSSMPLGDDGVIIDWVFPHFDSYVYYDPVMGDDSVDAQTTDTDTTTEAPTTEAPSSMAPVTMNASYVSLLSVVFTVMAGVQWMV